MYPAGLLVLVLLAALSSESTATLPYNNTGKKFIVVFPENIASYYPSTPTNLVQITALFDDTQVICNQTLPEINMMAGESKNFTQDPALELNKKNISDRVLDITSNKLITVQVMSLKQDSLQTALIIPAEKLNTTYLIPPIPTITGTTDPKDLVVRTVTERGPFRIIIVNGQESNTVTVTGSERKQFPLEPYHVAQILLEANKTFKSVTAVRPVAVLFGHPCAIQVNCTCGLLYTILLPTPNDVRKYLIPPFLATGAEKETVILKAQEDYTDVVAYNPNSPVINTAGAAILYRPGLLLTLISEADFGACFVLTSIPQMKNFAVIVVQGSATDGIYVGSDPLSADWQDLQDTGYSWTKIPLLSAKTIIWHASSKMGVYFFGSKNSTLFGNPAPVISSSPDFRGCPVTPEVLEIGQNAVGWPESLRYCKASKLELICLSNKTFQNHVFGRLPQSSGSSNSSLQNMWIGMRQRSLNGEWYWVNGDPVTDTKWDEGEPGGVDDSQCAIMRLTRDKSFAWSDDDCCKPAHPVCYKSPNFLNL